MLTPEFSIKQNGSYLFITIKALHSKMDETEIYFDETEFKFYSKPYYLRLNLPGNVVQNGHEEITWDSDNTSYLVKVPKANDGEYFEGLDMLTTLLSPKSTKSKISLPTIEVIGSVDSFDEEDEIDWSIEQTPWTDDKESILMGEKYGFGHKYTGVFARLKDELYNLIDLKDPEHKPISMRKKERFERENNDFSEEHYLGDLFEAYEEIEEIIAFKAPWDDASIDATFTRDEMFQMKNLPKKDYLFEKEEQRFLFLGMVDILFAYAYDLRTTQGEHSVESGWTISKLSATLSWFDTFTSLNEVVISSFRRILSYPLYRRWDLAIKIFEDVQKILLLGKYSVIKSMLDIHKLLNLSGEYKYLFNELYITDYCIWLQKINQSTFSKLGCALKKVSIDKAAIKLDLEELETAAKTALQEENSSHEDPCGLRQEVQKIEDKLATINIDKNDRNTSYH